MDFSTYSKELHKEVKRNFKRRQVVSNGIDDIWAMDLIDFIDWEEFNHGFKYILCVIDVFSKFAWCIPLKDKTAVEINKAFKEILKYSKRKPKMVWCDSGSEFYNKLFQSTLKTQSILMYSTFGEHKASVVERFNRTIKTWLWKYFSSNNTVNWLDILPTILNYYNNTKKHRSINMTPAEASKKENQQKVFTTLYGERLEEMAEAPPRKPKFKIGDFVRISRQKQTFEKGFHDNYSKEVFKVIEVLPTYPTTYKLMDMLEEPIEGSFYENELLKTQTPNKRDIESIIKTKTVKGKKQFLVKFIGLDSKFNKWLREDEMVTLETV